MRDVRRSDGRQKSDINTGFGICYGRIYKAGHLVVGAVEIHKGLISLNRNRHPYTDRIIGMAVVIKEGPRLHMSRLSAIQSLFSFYVLHTDEFLL